MELHFIDLAFFMHSLNENIRKSEERIWSGHFEQGSIGNPLLYDLIDRARGSNGKRDLVQVRPVGKADANGAINVEYARIGALRFERGAIGQAGLTNTVRAYERAILKLHEKLKLNDGKVIPWGTKIDFMVKERPEGWLAIERVDGYGPFGILSVDLRGVVPDSWFLGEREKRVRDYLAERTGH
ncbi:MAG: hypothetical protein AABW80_00810 [Nanoarchaeota archaeon]